MRIVATLSTNDRAESQPENRKYLADLEAKCNKRSYGGKKRERHEI
jgi:hypothetical protein